MKDEEATVDVKPSGIKWPIFQTLGQASSSMGIPLGLLRDARRKGCPAFKHSRVDPGELLPWLFKHMLNQDVRDWTGLNKKADWDLKQCELAELNGVVIKKDVVTDWLGEAMGLLFGRMEGMASEMAVTLVGLDSVGTKKKIDEFTEQLKQDLWSKARELVGKDGAK